MEGQFGRAVWKGSLEGQFGRAVWVVSLVEQYEVEGLDDVKLEQVEEMSSAPLSQLRNGKGWKKLTRIGANLTGHYGTRVRFTD